MAVCRGEADVELNTSKSLAETDTVISRMLRYTMRHVTVRRGLSVSMSVSTSIAKSLQKSIGVAAAKCRAQNLLYFEGQ